MNLFELFVKIGVDDQASDKISSLSSKLGNGLKTAAKIGTAAVAAAGTAIVAIGKQAIEQYAEYEQLVGGVETLFKQSADTVMGYAENAYKTAGLSANEYMNTVTSFSASLLQSLGGDTEAAAKYADMAITDMSDNANKMGTSMEMIQNAYQGFAKQNYTMLDNLKLGYGGTKEEMQRLLEDAEKLSGIEYDISSYADIVDAIHVVQTEMGITGTTAEEASTTIQGSLSSMKSAWKDLMAALADENADLGSKIDNLVTSAGNVYQNIEPRILQVVDGIASFANLIVPKIIDTIGANAPMLLEAAVSIVGTLAGALISNLPTLLTAALELVVSLAESIADNTGAFVDGVVQIITAVAGAILNNLPALVAAVIEIIVNLAAEIVMHIPEILEATAEVVLAVIGALFAALGSFLEVGGAWIDSLNAAIAAKVSEVVAAAQELVSGFISTLAAKFAEIYEQAGEWVEENLITPISDKVEEFINIGQSVVDKIREGISNAWGSLTSWFAGIWDSLFGNLRVNVGVGGSRGRSHASGLDYVPYNGYPAVLHRGEAVLTSREADNWRKGGAGNAAAAQPITLNLELKTELDGAVLARKLYKYNLAESVNHGTSLINA